LSSVPAEISWNHAKKKEDDDEGLAEFGGQGAPKANHEEGSRDQASEKVNSDIRYLAFTNEFLEVVLKNQCDILEQLTILAASTKIMGEWFERNWSETKIRGPETIVVRRPS
jgi:hypothetical protein